MPTAPCPLAIVPPRIGFHHRAARCTERCAGSPPGCSAQRLGARSRSGAETNHIRRPCAGTPGRQRGRAAHGHHRLAQLVAGIPLACCCLPRTPAHQRPYVRALFAPLLLGVSWSCKGRARGGGQGGGLRGEVVCVGCLVLGCWGVGVVGCWGVGVLGCWGVGV